MNTIPPRVWGIVFIVLTPPPLRGQDDATTGTTRTENPMKRVQHDEIKPGMKVKVDHHGPRGRWVAIEHVYEVRASSPTQEACVNTRAFYVSDQNRKRFSLMLYAKPEGY